MNPTGPISLIVLSIRGAPLPGCESPSGASQAQTQSALKRSACAELDAADAEFGGVPSPIQRGVPRVSFALKLPFCPQSAKKLLLNPILSSGGSTRLAVTHARESPQVAGTRSGHSILNGERAPCPGSCRSSAYGGPTGERRLPSLTSLRIDRPQGQEADSRSTKAWDEAPVVADHPHAADRRVNGKRTLR